MYSVLNTWYVIFLQASDTYVGEGQGKVTLMKPDCSATWSAELARCTKQRGSCAHEEDTYIKCERK